ncbi:MAG: response regulator, partial [Frankiaceae bacterium]|nr:response regulator [Frankiaceae bacterium]
DILDVVRLAIEVTVDWDVVTCQTLEDGEAALTGDAADVVLLDMSVTNGDPTAAVQRLSTAGSGSRVILLTARSMLTAEVETTGAAGYIGKPFDPMSLADEIGAILGWD